MAKENGSGDGTTKVAQTPKRTRTARGQKSAEQVAQGVRQAVSRHLVNIGVDHERAPKIMSSLRDLTNAIHPASPAPTSGGEA